MAHSTRLWVAVAALTFAVSAAAHAQSTTTGSLTGTLTDASGGVLPGATVTLSGPNIQGTRLDTTDGQGTYHFRNLPPGRGYRVAAALSGFREAVQDNIQVLLGQEGSVNLTLAPAGVTEQVEVTAATPLVDVSSTSAGVNITSNLFETLPSARGFQQLTAIAPGVALDMGDHDRRFSDSPTVGASSAPENNYIIDGLSVTDPRYGTSGANLTMNFVQEVQVLTSGFQAEYGRSTGGVFNVVTKSGGNEFHGDVFNYNRSKSWTDADLERRRNKELTTFADQIASYDVGGSIGGPILRDKVWFFGAYGPIRRTNHLGSQIEDSVPIDTSGREFDRDSDVYAGKVTWTPRSSHTLVFSTFGDPTQENGWLAGSTTGNNTPNADETSALRVIDSGGHNYGVKYTGVLGSNWLLDLSVGQHRQRAGTEAATDAGRRIPRQIDETFALFEHGGFTRLQDDAASRTAFAGRITSLIGAHDLRYGVDMELNDYDSETQETWYRFFGPQFASEGFGSYIQERNYTLAGKGSTRSTAFFAQDSWRATSNVTVNLGLRYEIQRLDSANDVAIGGRSDADINTCVVDLQCRTVNGLSLNNNWAPRLGVSWDPLGTGKSKIYGFWGRFYEAIPLDMNIRAINGEDYIITQYVIPQTLTSDNWFNPNGSPLAINGPWQVRRVSELTAITPLDEDLKSQFEDQLIFGAEYQFRPAWSVGARFINRELRRIIEDIGTFTNPEDPLELTGYVIGNPGEGFFGAPFDQPSRSYNALELTLTRAFADRWHLNSSFVYARARGNHEGLYMSGYDQLDPNITALYDIPSFLPNSDGRLRSDKPYQFKMFGAYTFDWGLTLSEGFLLSAGVPISAQGPEIVNGYGDGTIFLQERGSQGRTPAYWNVDFHADYRLPIARLGAGRNISVILDIFNLFNSNEILERDQDYTYEGDENFHLWADESNLDEFGNPRFNSSLPASPFYKQSSLRQSPRAMQVGFKFTF
jgi:outer membrane receptor protein involved in Fe transport